MTTRTIDHLALFAALLSLGVIGVRPGSTRMVDPAIVVVRAPGATVAEARALAESLHAGSIADAADRGSFGTEGAELHVVGWGLDEGELRRSAGRTIILHPRPLPEGIRDLSASGPLTLGDLMTVRVSVRTAAPRILTLSDDTGPVDSARVPAGEVVTLSLHHAPRAAGMARYALRLGSRSDTFSVFVDPPEPPVTLILASAPAREWSDLRDWLAGQGARVEMRTTVSRDRVATDLVNGAALEGRLTPASLARLDLVVTDGRTLSALPAAERAALRRAIGDGLGLLLVHDRAAREGRALSSSERSFFLPWRTVAAGDIDTRDVRPRHEGVRPSETPVAAEAYTFVPMPDGVTSFDDGQGGILASSVRRGAGRIGATVVNGAGRWLRGGEPAAYAAYWSALIRPTARADGRTERWDAGRGPVMLDHQISLVHWGGTAAVVDISGDSVTFAADPLTPGRSVASWWPRKAGVVTLDRTGIWVSDSSAWPAWRAAERRRITELAIGAARGGMTNGTRIPHRVPWPLWPFFIVLVTATGWLWRRIGN